MSQVRSIVENAVVWLAKHDGDFPSRTADDDQERCLANAIKRLTSRRHKPYASRSTKPSDQQLTEEEAKLFDAMFVASRLEKDMPGLLSNLLEQSQFTQMVDDLEPLYATMQTLRGMHGDGIPGSIVHQTHLDSIVGMAMGEAPANVSAPSHTHPSVAFQGDAVAEARMQVENDPGRHRQAELAPDAPFKRLRTDAPLSDSKPVTLCMRGLNIQWPFSQLLLMGAKTEEVREYLLDYRGIANTGKEVWLVETKGPHTKAATNAIVGDLQIAPRPSAAQIVGTISFASAFQYDSKQIFQEARDSHRIAVGSKFDWDGGGARYGWRVDKVRSLVTPVPVGTTGQTGFGEREFSVVFAAPLL